MSHTYQGYEEMPPEPDRPTHLQPKRYRIVCLCHRCGEEYSWVAKAPGGKDRPCPRKACKEAARQEEIQAAAERIAKMLVEQKAPGHIGANVQVKAVDATAEIVMQDYGLTNLQDNLREGDSAAPKLEPRLQKMADNMFGGGALSNQRTRKMAHNAAQRAIAGLAGPPALNPGNIVSGTPNAKVLRKVDPAPPRASQAPQVRILGRR